MVCMTFIALAMMYYGLILFKLRTILKIEDIKLASKEHEKIQLSNSVIKSDRFMAAGAVSLGKSYDIVI